MAKEQELILMCGIPGSGKSTISKRLSEYLGYEIVNKDNIRKLLFGDPNRQSGKVTREDFLTAYPPDKYPDYERIFDKAASNHYGSKDKTTFGPEDIAELSVWEAVDLIRAGKSVILDNTNIRYRESTLNAIRTDVGEGIKYRETLLYSKGDPVKCAEICRERIDRNYAKMEEYLAGGKIGPMPEYETMLPADRFLKMSMELEASPPEKDTRKGLAKVRFLTHADMENGVPFTGKMAFANILKAALRCSNIGYAERCAGSMVTEKDRKLAKKDWRKVAGEYIPELTDPSCACIDETFYGKKSLEERSVKCFDNCFTIMKAFLMNSDGTMDKAANSYDFTSLLMASLMHDTGKIDSYIGQRSDGKASYLGHQDHSSERAAALMIRLGYDDDRIRHTMKLIDNHVQYLGSSWDRTQGTWLGQSLYEHQFQESFSSEMLVEEAILIASDALTRENVDPSVYEMLNGLVDYARSAYRSEISESESYRTAFGDRMLQDTEALNFSPDMIDRINNYLMDIYREQTEKAVANADIGAGTFNIDAGKHKELDDEETR